MKISWLFEIDETYYWSTKAVTFDSTNYTAKVLPESFDGIQMRWDVSRRGLITPSDLSFEIENTDGSLSRSDLEGEYCTIILVTDGTESRRWKFYIQAATSSYGKIRVDCVDILQKVLQGEYPNTQHPREAFPSEMHEVDEDDTYRVPVTFGKAYIPLMLVYSQTEGQAYYMLGESDTYVIHKVKSPPDTGKKTVWTSADYTFSTLVENGHTLADFEIAVTDTPGTYESGTWQSNQKPLVQYNIDGDADPWSPDDVIKALLLSWGTPTGDVDLGGTFAAAATTYASQGIEWEGAFYQSEMRETILIYF